MRTWSSDKACTCDMLGGGGGGGDDCAGLYEAAERPDEEISASALVTGKSRREKAGGGFGGNKKIVSRGVEYVAVEVERCRSYPPSCLDGGSGRTGAPS